MGDKFAIRFRDDTVLFASFHELLLTINVGTIMPEHIDRAESVINDVRKANANGKIISITMFNITKSHVSKSPTTRDKLQKFLNESKEVTSAAATVIGGPALLSTALRAIVSTTIMLSRPAHPSKIFTATGEAVTWILQYASPVWTRSDHAACPNEILKWEKTMAHATA